MNFVSTVFAIVVAGGCYFLGGFGRIFVGTNEAGQPVDGFDSIVPTMVETLPEILIGIVVVLVLSASMSTLSSLVLTSSSTLTLDLSLPVSKKKLSEKKTIVIMRLFIAVFLVVSVVIALNKNALITDLMGYSWGALAGAFLGPFLLGLFWKGVTKASVYVSIVWGVAISLVHMILNMNGMLSGSFLGFTIASPVNLGAFAMVTDILIVFIVSLITPRMKKADVDRIFSCYDEKVEVAHAVALSGDEGNVKIDVDKVEMGE